MAKLYPPHLEGKLPAFQGTTIVVPFSMNQAVGPAAVSGFHVQIRTINKDTVIYEGSATNFDKSSGATQTSTVNFGHTKSNCFASFNIGSAISNFKVGQFYRIQLAYEDDNGNANSVPDIGYYSSVGVAKYTATPTVAIEGMTTAATNKHLYTYSCIYRQTDATEKLYSSYLIMRDSDGNEIYNSGVVKHSFGNDTLPNVAHESFTIPFDIEFGKIYRLCWYVTTVNDLTTRTEEYRIMMTNNGGVEFEGVTDLVVRAISNYSRGTVDVTFIHKNPTILTLKGMYRISRSVNKKPYEWQFISTLFCTNNLISDICIPDYTVEQGKTYIYCIQQYNNSEPPLVSNRSISAPVTVDFEDFYLIDADRQLKIRYNPKISSMKNTVVESKMNTIGSKYPYFVRSGVVDYKEFSIAGLVSYHMDDDEDFIKWEDLGFKKRNYTRSNSNGVLDDEELPNFDISSKNILAERLFKLEVLDWLNNGKPKILKSPTEGNYLVMLMNVSMTPNDSVGRMLHNFSCQASEIGTCDYATLASYGYFEDRSFDSVLLVPQWKTINFSSVDPETGQMVFKTGKILPSGDDSHNLTVIDFREMTPGSYVDLYTNDVDQGRQRIYIGATGAYHAEITNGVSQIELPADYHGGGYVTYQTSGPLITDFDSIKSYSDEFICGRQFIGYQGIDNIISSIQNTRNKIVEFEQLRLFKREVVDVYARYEDRDTRYNIPMNTQTLYYDAYGQEPVRQDRSETAYTSYTYDVDNQLSLFRINWLNYYYVDDQKYYYDIRDVSTPVMHPDGTWHEETTQYYYREETVSDATGIHTNVTTFPIYSGYYYNPVTQTVVEDDYDLFTAVVGYTSDATALTKQVYVNVEDKERITYDKSFIPSSLRLGDGVIADLTYIYQTIIYSYEYSKSPDVVRAAAVYKAARNAYYTMIYGATETQFYSSAGVHVDMLTRVTTSESYMVNGVGKTYNNCTTDAERSEWRRQRNKQVNKLLENVHKAYNDLVQKLRYAILNDLTRG